jgi:regulator of protease activity HflC (stomatin/prohibitin superfamily)
MNVVLIYALVILIIFSFFKMIRIVPEADTYIVEQFGKYKRTLGSGLHLIIPFIQKIAYKVELREQVIDVEPQICITSDNVQVSVDGILYLKVMDPEKASYGIDAYRYASAQMAKTTMRSEIGKLELDKTFSERDQINEAIVKAVDEASDPWGIKVTRYEIKDITPTETIEKAMEQQMRAEREKRAEILTSDGEKTARINVSKGERQYAINVSEGDRQKRINEAEGRAQGVEITSEATAEGLRIIAEALRQPKGKNAMSLRLAEQYINQFGHILEETDTSVLPIEAAQLKSIIEAAGPVFQQGGGSGGSGGSGGAQSGSSAGGAQSGGSSGRTAQSGGSSAAHRQQGGAR